jgi:hypothetical protein
MPASIVPGRRCADLALDRTLGCRWIAICSQMATDSPSRISLAVLPPHGKAPAMGIGVHADAPREVSVISSIGAARSVP